MRAYAIGIPTLEMAFGVGGKTDTLIEAVKRNKNFIGAGFDGGFSMMVFKTKEAATASSMIARQLGFEIVAIGEANYDL